MSAKLYNGSLVLVCTNAIIIIKHSAITTVSMKICRMCNHICRSNGHHSVSLDESEEMFPRGGQETLTPLEKRVLHQKAKQDVLFGEVSTKIRSVVFINYPNGMALRRVLTHF